ncbi:hypothetical protein B1810_07590 [Panacagrimonas perspica]|nr:hypothetical protein B1810_07590 [Panacagrimonas perspica]
MQLAIRKAQVSEREREASTFVRRLRQLRVLARAMCRFCSSTAARFSEMSLSIPSALFGDPA